MGLNSTIARAAVVTFIASFCTLVVELVAGRVLAPYVGVSLYTWTSIIGVVLAGISLGAYAGGWLADRRPLPSTLGWLLLAAGCTSILIAPATDFLAGDEGMLTALGVAMTLLGRVVLLSFLLFFLPSFFLGMISPVAVKLAVRDLATAGRVVGQIYAFSTLGSILGTFVTGFYLVAHFGTRKTLVGAGAVLLASAFVFGGLLGRRGRAVAIAILVAGALYAGTWPGTLPPPYQDPLLQPSSGTGTLHHEESQYYTISVERTVSEETGAPLLALHLDHLLHSYADPDDPAHLEYGYLQHFRDVAAFQSRIKRAPRLLFIGGGGYTLPRLIARTNPTATIDVVEIDPAVSRVARRWFGVPRTPRLRTINEDARWFALRAKGPYDAIFIDAFNDLSVPYHLTTREFSANIRDLLAPDGVVSVNVVDDMTPRGRFLASYVRTMQAEHGVANVGMIVDAVEDLASTRSTAVVIASKRLAPVLASLQHGYVLPHRNLQRFLAAREAIVLTDDYAPVDAMLAPLFADRFVDEQ
ncbi:MAG TPA: fused MFS/spermidine synthase [Thermoanaerobaculia bacterium]|nr:fused MFS/spermidine synthase [Thermoanaerobaculia bacterium]